MLISSAGTVADGQRAFMNALGVVTAVVDPDGVVTDLSDAGLRLTGWSMTDDTRHLLWDGIADEAEADALRRTLANALAGRSTDQSGCIWRGADGLDTALVWSVNAVPDTRFALAVAISAPGLAARLAEDRVLRERSDRLDVALSAVQAGWFDWDMVADEHYWAPELYELFGLEPSPTPPSTDAWRSLVHPDDFEPTMAEVGRAIAERRIFRSEYRIIRPDGEVRWISAAGHGVFNGEGQPVRASGIAFDITERRRAEQEIERGRLFTDAVLDSVPGMLYLYDSQGRLVRWNRQHETMTGYSADELAGRGLLDWYRDSQDDIDRITAGVQRCLETGYGEAEGNLQTKDGGTTLCHFTAVRVEIDGETYFAGIGIDISEQRRNEQALARERVFTNAVLDSVPGMLYLYSRDGRLVRWNKQHETLTGYSADELPYMSLLDWYKDNPHDMELVRNAALRCFEEGYAEAEGHLQAKDGSVALYHLTAVRVEIDGQDYIAGIGIDISERRRAEQALRENEARQRAMIASISDVIAIIDADGINRFKSPNIERWFGWKPEEVVGQSTWLLVHPDDLTEAQAVMASVVADPGITRYGECRYRCRDGSYKWIGYTAANLLDDPDVRGVLLNYHDITEHRRMEDELAAEKERLAVTLHSIGDGVIATDTACRVVLMNKVAEQLTGWRTAQAAGRPLPDVLHLIHADTREPLPDPAAHVLATGGAVGLASRTMLRARGGEEYLIADSGAPIRDRDSRIVGAVLVFRDVTDEERRDAAMRRNQKLESLSILAGGVAHDFNNLLTGILGNVSLASLEAGDNDSLAYSLAEAEEAAVRAKGLTQQLLTFASGGAPVRRLVHIEEVVRSTTVFCCRGTAVDCRFAFADDLWLAEIDENQIAQVVQNLVINATQAMTGGGLLTVGASNERLAPNNAFSLRPGPYLRLFVADQGCGMPADVTEHAFDPYFTTKAQGSGLGLAVCHSVVSRHAGHIALRSTPGEGTTFEVYLPATPEASAARAVAPVDAARGTGRVLLLDDESSIRSLAQRSLEHLGYQATAVADGVEAVTAYAAALEEGRGYDVVIMDLTIPGGMGGREALARLREIDPGVRAIVSSGYATDPIMANYTEHGFRAVLTKPYRLNDMALALAEVLGDD
ncbi:MAG: PAS domain S-box protein [Armatimonadetes bacterium]|nr:PAS domain S-box protein [Armatimonadota bacterium]